MTISVRALRPTPRITVYPLSFNSHVRQVLVGFVRLAAQASIDVRFSAGAYKRYGVRPRHFLDDARLCAVAEVDGRRLVFDMHDNSDVFDPLLAIADLYFKRSYSRTLHGGDRKIRPYGLNYGVETDRPWATGAWLALNFEPGRHRVREAWRAIKLPPCSHYEVANLLGRPRPSKDPRAIFLTRLWDPDDRADRPQERREDRRQISQMRVACVEALRRRFGDRVTGGLQPNSYAKRHWPSLIADPALCRRDRFLAQLDRHDVCIATDGLYGSIGWKFAEYVAKARAIVTEPLRFELIGPIAAHRNYLEFDDPQTCVERVEALFDDEALRSSMMQANAEYFQDYGLPEQLISHALAAQLP
jgi:hypothetical protein